MVKPVSVAVEANLPAFQLYTSGVVTKNCGTLVDHAILAVGYDDAKQQVCFRNSWNTTWGDKGYGYLPYSYFKGGLVHDAWQAN